MDNNSLASKRKRSDDNESGTAHHKKKSSLDSSSPASVNALTTTTPSALSPEVESLLQHLDKHEQTETDSNELTWSQALQKHTSTPSFHRLAKFVSAARLLQVQHQKQSPHSKAYNIYPPADQTFATLNLTPLAKVRVVIVGQDPYHQFNQGHGLAFSVQKGVTIPPSLRNIYKELVNDAKVDFDNHNHNGGMPIPKHGHLQRWAQQGVLMLNTVLTVQDSKPNSHQNQGWEAFTDQVLRAVDSYARAQQSHVVYLLWGKPASKKVASIGLKETKWRTVICTSHPSPLGANKTKSPFLGSRCFSRCNEALRRHGLEGIDWNVEDDEK